MFVKPFIAKKCLKLAVNVKLNVSTTQKEILSKYLNGNEDFDSYPALSFIQTKWTVIQETSMLFITSSRHRTRQIKITIVINKKLKRNKQKFQSYIGLGKLWNVTLGKRINHVSLATLVMFKWTQSLIELYSRSNVSTLQSSVFSRGDLMLWRCSLYSRNDFICQEGWVLLWQIWTPPHFFKLT